jgi:hypothetical protein
MMPTRPASLLRLSAVLFLARPVTAAAQTLVREAARDSAAGVPRGMMPPAGKCSVWMEGVPATRQPAPTDCATALRKKPANARVLYGPSAPEPRQAGLEAAREKRSLLTPIGERRPALAQDDRRPAASTTSPRMQPTVRESVTTASPRTRPAVREPAASTAAPAPPKAPPPPPKKPERP